MAESKNKIRLNGIQKTFRTKDKQTIHVLDDVSLDIRENEFLVILGPGQCGKTVLLNIMAGLETADSGEVQFAGGTPAFGDIGFVFQRYALFPWKTVLQNVEINQKFKGKGREERREAAKKYIDLVGLSGFEHAYPAQLSGGMKQRVGIARAYATQSDIMLMDEPFGALDAQTRYQMQEEILKVWQRARTTVVFVTNNIEEAVYLGDRIILLSNKPTRVVKEFVPQLGRPRNNVAADFLKLRNEIADAMDLSL